MSPGKKLLTKPPRWYEFDRLIPYQDIVFVVGGLLVAAGAWWIYPPSALLIAGAGLIWLAILMGRTA